MNEASKLGGHWSRFHWGRDSFYLASKAKEFEVWHHQWRQKISLASRCDVECSQITINSNGQWFIVVMLSRLANFISTTTRQKTTFLEVKPFFVVTPGDVFATKRRSLLWLIFLGPSFASSSSPQNSFLARSDPRIDSRLDLCRHFFAQRQFFFSSRLLFAHTQETFFASGWNFSLLSSLTSFFPLSRAVRREKIGLLWAAWAGSAGLGSRRIPEGIMSNDSAQKSRIKKPSAATTLLARVATSTSLIWRRFVPRTFFGLFLTF